jgi:small subunit ribosomal protein S20
MANHKSAQKRIRSSAAKYMRNRYQLKTCKTAIKQLKQIKDKVIAEQSFNKVVSMIDKIARKNVIHPNKAARTKSQLAHHLTRLI